MNVIDVALRAASRDRAPMISFRRTDADRRPARRVAMPNDGPAPDRFARSEALRAHLKLKATVPAPTPEPEPALTPQERLERNLARCFVAVAKGERTLAEMSPGLGFGVDRLRDFTDILVKRGLISKTLERRSNVAVCVFELTLAGRAVWEAR